MDALRILAMSCCVMYPASGSGKRQALWGGILPAARASRMSRFLRSRALMRRSCSRIWEARGSSMRSIE